MLLLRSVSVTELVILIQSQDIDVVGFMWFREADFDKVKLTGSTQRKSLKLRAFRVSELTLT